MFILFRMAARQPMLPPFGVGVHYKIFSATNPFNAGEQVIYAGPDPTHPHLHVFNPVDPNDLPFLIDTNNPNYGTNGYFVGYKGNAGGRRKSRRSKRSKRSHRKTKRRY